MFVKFFPGVIVVAIAGDAEAKTNEGIATAVAVTRFLRDSNMMLSLLWFALIALINQRYS